MKATRITKIDTVVDPSVARAYGGPHTAGLEFDDGIDALVIFPDSPNTTGERKIALGGYKSLGTVTTTPAIDFNTAQFQRLNFPAGNLTPTFSNGVAGREYFLALKQDGTGSRTVTWPAAVKWSAGSAPTLTTTASRTDLLRFIFDGTNYLGSTVALNYDIA